MEICTIGFTKHTAESFFTNLKRHGVERLIDVRLNNVSQLAGFAKRDDLKYFLETLCQAEYVHEPEFAPTPELLKSYRNGDIDWQQYESTFLGLMEDRCIEQQFTPDFFEPRSVLLCSEHTAENCHRRLVVDYLNRRWGGIKAIHLPGYRNTARAGRGPKNQQSRILHGAAAARRGAVDL